MNSITIRGNLGKDPEMSYTPNGTAVTKMTVATKDYVGNSKYETTWHNVTVWAAQAENCEKYLKKGSSVLITGRLKRSRYGEKGSDIKDKVWFEIVARDVEFLSGGSKSEDVQDARPDWVPELDENGEEHPF